MRKKILAAAISGLMLVPLISAFQVGMAGAQEYPATIDVSPVKNITNTGDASGNGYYERDPQLLMVSDGTWYLIYSRSQTQFTAGGNPDTLKYDIYYQTSTDDGASWSAATKVLDAAAIGTTSSFRSATICEADGKIWVIGADIKGLEGDIYANTYSGGSWSGQSIIFDGTYDTGAFHVDAIAEGDNIRLFYGIQKEDSGVGFIKYNGATGAWDTTVTQIGATVGYQIPRVIKEGSKYYLVSTNWSNILFTSTTTPDIVPWPAASNIVTAPAGGAACDPTILKYGNGGGTEDLIVFHAPSYADASQPLEYVYSTNAGSTWSSSIPFTDAAHGPQISWDMMPRAYLKDASTIMVFFSMEQRGANRGQGDIVVCEWHVSATIGNKHYTTIQDAIGNASPGDTISIAEGTYTLSSTLNLTLAGLKILGSSESAVIINASSISGYGIAPSADNILLENFTLNGPAADANISYGIKASHINNLTIRNVTVQGSGRSEIDLNTVNGGLLENITTGGQNTKGVGIAVSHSNNITLRNITTLGNVWGGVGLFDTTEGPTTNVIFEGTNNFGEANPIYIDAEFGQGVSNITLPAGFGYAVRNTVFRDAEGPNRSEAFTFFQSSQETAINAALALQTAPFPANSASYIQTVGVGGTLENNFIVGNGMSIQSAINAASPGGTVNVANGNYNATTSNSTEDPSNPGWWWFVTVDKPLILIGESRDGVILDGTGLQDENRSTGIWVSSSNVTVKNLTIQNFKSTKNPTWACYGLYVMEKFRHYVWGEVATLENVTAENLRAVGNVYPFYFMKTEHAVVKDSISENNLGDGIWVAWGSHYATVEGNTVTNSGDHGIWVGISWTGEGPSNHATIINNYVNGAREGGISFVASDGATISGNTITNVAAENEAVGGWSVGALNLKDGPSNVEAYNNIIYNNDGSWGGHSGTGNGVGIDGAPSNINLHHNNIYGNAGYGVYNYSSVAVMAENNWWGDPTGPRNPTTNPSATGDNVSDNVDYTPWLDASYPGGNSRSWNVQNVDTGATFNSIQAAIAAASSGDTVLAAAGVYDEYVDVNKSLSLTGLPGAIVKPNTTSDESIIEILSDDVAVKGFEVDGSSCNYNWAGIGTWSGVKNVTIENNTVHGIGNDYPGGGDSGLGIGFWRGDNTPFDNILIEANTVHDTDRMGIYVGARERWDLPWLLSSATIRNNIAHDAMLKPNENYPGGCGGITVDGAKDTTIANNTVYDIANTMPGIYIAHGSGPGNLIENNEVYGQAYGISVEVDRGDVIFGTVSPTAPQVHLNNIHNNIQYGLDAFNLSGKTVDATLNWWGDPTGPRNPTTNPTGLGDNVGNNVNYEPWLDASYGTPLKIENIAPRNVTATSVTITWQTNLNATSVVEYGATTSYGFENSDNTLVKTHAVTLTGLSGDNVYHFKVRSTDLAGLENASADNTFGTASPPVTLPTGAFVENSSASVENITPGAPATVVIENVPITGLEISVHNSVENVKVTVTQSTSSPSGISISAPGVTFGYLSIETENISNVDIDNVVITFRVEKSWISANGVDAATITLRRYSSGAWTDLPTTKTGEDATYVYYSALSPGLSVYLVSGSSVPSAPAAVAPDFSVGISPVSGSVTQGGSTTVTVSVSSIAGFTSTVSLSASGPPSGATASFSLSSGTPSFDSTLTISTPLTTPTGTYTITITGTGGGKTHSATFSLTVTAAPPAQDFTISVSPTSGSVVQGGSAGATVSITSIGGFTNAVGLSASDLPSGATVSFSPSSGTPSFGSTLTISTSSTTPAGTYTVTITGTAGGLAHTATYALTLTPPAAPPATPVVPLAVGIVIIVLAIGIVMWIWRVRRRA